MRNVTRQFHAAEKYNSNPVLIPDLPWERSVGHNAGTILYDGGKFRMWYQMFACAKEAKGTVHAAYAESSDGIRWQKPDLGLESVNGLRENNILAYDLEAVNVIADEHESNLNRRYKMFYFGTGKKKRGTIAQNMGTPGNWGWCVAFSSDGIHWNHHPDNPVFTGADDTGTLLGWDELQRAYVAYAKPKRPDAEGGNPDDDYISLFPNHRKIGITKSANFVEWSPLKTVIAPDEYDSNSAQFYSMPAFKYHDWYIGLVYMLYCDPDDPILLNHKGLMDIQLAVSRDGESWSRLGGHHSFIPRGAKYSFDMGMVGPNAGLVEKDGKLWFYYNGWSQEHYQTKAFRRADDPGLFAMGRMCSGIGLAWLRKDGFISIGAGEDEGSIVTTAELVSKGITNLTINAVAPEDLSYLRVGVLDASGKKVRGFGKEDCISFKGDSISFKVDWGGKNLSGLPVGEYSFVFTMRHAGLYSYTLI